MEGIYMKLKRLTSILLTIALVFSSICVMDNSAVKAAGTAADVWKASAITAPLQDKLIGAGYIDIKWNNNLENVSKYDVYVDGKFAKTLSATTSEQMVYEMYTTTVSAHTAYLIATLKDGTKVKSDTRRFYVTKKGVCANARDMAAALDPADLNLGWYYDWGPQSIKELREESKTQITNTKFDDLEFVPMVWGEPSVAFSKIFDKVKAQGYKYMLAYNEPDLKVEANVTPSTTIRRWDYEFIANKGNMRLGSPATSVFHTWSDWWSEFWNGLSANSKNQMSFMALHSYQKSWSGAKSAQQYLQNVDEVYETYHKPIWITEFAFWKYDKNDVEGCKKVQEFMKIVCKGLNERPYVERYAWFCPDYNSTAASSSSIYEYSTGKITDIGKIYAQIGNPAGYPAKTYGVASSTNVNTSPAACAAAMETKLYRVTGKKKAYTYAIKYVSEAAGYEMQYSQSKKFKKAKKYHTKTKYIKRQPRNVKTIEGKIKISKKDLKKKKKKIVKKTVFYVRVRAYKYLDGKKLYCAWSERLKVKVKK